MAGARAAPPAMRTAAGRAATGTYAPGMDPMSNRGCAPRRGPGA